MTLKAKELVRQYWDLGGMDIVKSKVYALIAINEIIKYHESLYNNGFKDVHIALSSPIKTYNDILNPLLKHLEQVKQEIERL